MLYDTQYLAINIYYDVDKMHFSPTFHRGAADSTPHPRFSDCGAFNIDLRAPIFWYNSYLIVTMSVQNVQDIKGVPEKKPECDF